MTSHDTDSKARAGDSCSGQTASPALFLVSDTGRFKKHLDASQTAVWQIARWLNSKGLCVTINPTFKAPSHNEWEDYADKGDLQITQRVEVKQLSVNFTSAADWPHPDFIVCAKHAFDRAHPKPYMFIYLSKDAKHFAYVFGSQVKQWKVRRIKDRRYENVEQSFYVTDLANVKWGKF